MTTEKNPYESDDARETQALPPVDPTIELPVTPGEVTGDERYEADADDEAPAEAAAHDGTDEALPDAITATDPSDDPDATQIVEAGPAHEAHEAHEDDLADEIFRGEPTQALPVADPTLALPVAPPTQALPTQALPTHPLSVGEPAPTHTQAYPVQDAPVDPEPDPVSAPSPTPAPAPGPTPAVDPAAQWNATAQQRAQAPTDPALGDDPRNRGLRVGTVVWGFVIVAVGAGILALALGATYDLDLALIALLSVAGLVLVVSSIVSSSRRSARERARR
ncbi:hypothetical protein [Oerskovia sp. KBS0722]|uniref:hypothetical protein n=1 Tax=Oerskovia sp. KBS0722 TaxID=1179673 RepID=UPI00110F668C|nr:hypothetical protein [Oerskovia sp. KBS0722]QDW62667.1 hypothetical protein FFI11_009025 [Oerskovia sp. KBS0722]